MEVWTVRIHGLVFEPAQGKSAMIKLGLVRRLLGKRSIEGEASKLFEQRAIPFVVDHESGKIVTIQVGQEHFIMPASQPNGHFEGWISLKVPAEQREPIPFTVKMPQGDSRVFGGTISFVPQVGISIISDIDDTVKLTGVGEVSQVIDNTFCQPFRAVDGMAALYRTILRDGAVFYVTGSPWQLYESLWGFLQKEKFPAQGIEMRNFRLTDSSLRDFLGESKAFKVAAIRGLLSRFPHQRFILVGDSGEYDPEVYASVYAACPEQINGVAIRLVGNLKTDNRSRFEAVFADLPAEKWTTFTGVGDLNPKVKTWRAQGQ